MRNHYGRKLYNMHDKLIKSNSNPWNMALILKCNIKQNSVLIIHVYHWTQIYIFFKMWFSLNPQKLVPTNLNYRLTTVLYWIRWVIAYKNMSNTIAWVSFLDCSSVQYIDRESEIFWFKKLVYNSFMVFFSNTTECI